MQLISASFLAYNTFRNSFFALVSFQFFRVHPSFQLTKHFFLRFASFITSHTQSVFQDILGYVFTTSLCTFPHSSVQHRGPLPTGTPTTPFPPQRNTVFSRSCCYVVWKSPVPCVCLNLFLLLTKASIATEKILNSWFLFSESFDRSDTGHKRKSSKKNETFHTRITAVDFLWFSLLP